MADRFTKEKRSRIMSTVRGFDTEPELLVRRALHRNGYRFRLHRSDLPGKPDIVLPSRRVVVLVHGCFWHRHPGCKKATLPRQNSTFWKAKLNGNKARDVRVVKKLTALGWKVIVVWECERKSGFHRLLKELARRPTARHANA